MRTLVPDKHQGCVLLIHDDPAAFVQAQQCVSEMYANGLGCKRSSSEADKYQLMAAENGCAESQYNVGLKCMGGTKRHDWSGDASYRGRDPVEALKWWRLSAAQGNSGAQCSLGLALVAGDGCRPDCPYTQQYINMA